MTLDRRILSVMHLQPRVISVLSYYLTSLVNLSFCRFLSDGIFFPESFRYTTDSNFRFHNSLKWDNSMSERDFWISARLMFPPKRHFVLGSDFCFRSASDFFVFGSFLKIVDFLRFGSYIFYRRISSASIYFAACCFGSETKVFLPVHWYHPFWL